MKESNARISTGRGVLWSALAAWRQLYNRTMFPRSLTNNARGILRLEPTSASTEAENYERPLAKKFRVLASHRIQVLSVGLQVLSCGAPKV